MPKYPENALVIDDFDTFSKLLANFQDDATLYYFDNKVHLHQKTEDFFHCLYHDALVQSRTDVKGERPMILKARSGHIISISKKQNTHRTQQY